VRPLLPRERRVIALGLLALAVALVLFGFVLPVAQGFAERASTRERLLLLYERNQRLIGAVPAWSRQMRVLRENADHHAVMAPNRAAAGEMLKESLSRMIAAQGGTLREVADADARDGWIVVRAEAQLSLTQMTRGFRQFENQYPYAVIESLTIAADQSFSTGQLAPMDVRLEVAAPFIPSAPR